MTDTTKQIDAIAQDAAERVSKNTGVAPELCYGPIYFALEDAARATPVSAGQASKQLTDDAEELVGIAHQLHEVEHWAAKAAVRPLAEMAQRFLAAAKAAPAKPQSDLHSAEAVGVVDEGDDGLFIELLYGPNGNPLKRGDKVYAAASVGAQVAGEPAYWLEWIPQNGGKWVVHDSEPAHMNPDIEPVYTAPVYTAPASAPATVPEGEAAKALIRLCGQLDGMKRRMLHTPGTGQHHSYLMHEDVEAYVEEARKALIGAAPATVNVEGSADQLVSRLRGRAKYLRDMLGRVKTSGLLEEAANEIENRAAPAH